jgi:hypothetical protein
VGIYPSPSFANRHRKQTDPHHRVDRSTSSYFIDLFLYLPTSELIILQKKKK